MAPSGFNPSRGFDVFQIRWTEVKVPALIAIASLKPHGRGLPLQSVIIVTPLLEILIDRGALQQILRGLEKALWSIDADVL